ncbi:MAG: hypothetical protein Q9170_001570 [Blastenia crenularia]
MRVVTHSSHLLSTAESLQRVFLPSLRPLVGSLPQRNLPRQQFSTVTRRHTVFNPNPQKPIPTQPQNTGPPRDEAIGPSNIQVQVVNSDGSLQRPQNLQHSLADIDRKLNFLIHVGDKVHPRYADQPEPEEGLQDTRPRIPVCKVVPKMQFRLAEAKRLKPKKDVAAMSKQLSFHWTMAPNDLKHRLDKLKQFLDDGRRVDVIFGKKRKGWKHKKDITDEEASRMMKQIRDTVAEVEGAKEWKEMEGQLRGELVVHFEAKRQKQKQEVKKPYEEGYKVKKKFQEAHEEKLAGFSPMR